MRYRSDRKDGNLLPTLAVVAEEVSEWMARDVVTYGCTSGWNGECETYTQQYVERCGRHQAIEIGSRSECNMGETAHSYAGKGGTHKLQMAGNEWS